MALEMTIHTSCTVSALNSRECVRRIRFFCCFDMWTPFYALFAERGCPPNRVKPRPSRRPVHDGLQRRLGMRGLETYSGDHSFRPVLGTPHRPFIARFTNPFAFDKNTLSRSEER